MKPEPSGGMAMMTRQQPGGSDLFSRHARAGLVSSASRTSRTRILVCLTTLTSSWSACTPSTPSTVNFPRQPSNQTWVPVAGQVRASGSHSRSGSSAWTVVVAKIMPRQNKTEKSRRISFSLSSAGTRPSGAVQPLQYQFMHPILSAYISNTTTAEYTNPLPKSQKIIALALRQSPYLPVRLQRYFVHAERADSLLSLSD